ncbi:MAG: hypothetical protein KGL39_03190 [Patescibacteria group bacterium]|nr:hypothetical protein [Patescibacteria group bacterium]
MEDYSKLAAHAEDPDLFREFFYQHAINIGSPRHERDKGAGASLIARANFTARKRREMSERPGFDLNGCQKESRAHFTSRKVWSA